MGKDALVQQLVDSYDNWAATTHNSANGPACAGACGGAARMTQELYPYDRLFSPIKINRLTIKNRIVMAPMGNIDMCEETARVFDLLLGDNLSGRKEYIAENGHKYMDMIDVS